MPFPRSGTEPNPTPFPAESQQRNAPLLPELGEEVRPQPVESRREGHQPAGFVIPILALQVRRGPPDVVPVSAEALPPLPAVVQSFGARV